MDEREQLYQNVLDVAAKQLSYRALSTEGLRKKLLEKGCPEDAVEYALAWLQERQLLNDAAFAASVVRSYQKRGYGPMRIRQELRQRGVPREELEHALEGFQANYEKMQALLEKRLHGDVSDRKEVDKAVAALQRRGYVWSEIRAALSQYTDTLEGA